ncbi:hypothetical protein [Bacteroides intestinalis]|uniref:hypothetical protein n=3 Tax=Bacteroidales TaxID=171549 RepID=UPI00242FF523|nr:hypothetical protein [Bacteroides intestinalis]
MKTDNILTDMVTQSDFSNVAESIRGNLSSALPKMIEYKTYLQRNVLDVATCNELDDVKNGIVNGSLMTKLIILAKSRWQSGATVDLYCLAMSVATIIKEYDWGTEYLSDKGLFSLAMQIQNA